MTMTVDGWKTEDYNDSNDDQIFGPVEEKNAHDHSDLWRLCQSDNIF